jgi:hypothetical protein
MSTQSGFELASAFPAFTIASFSRPHGAMSGLSCGSGLPGTRNADTIVTLISPVFSCAVVWVHAAFKLERPAS